MWLTFLLARSPLVYAGTTCHAELVPLAGKYQQSSRIDARNIVVSVI